MHKLPSIGRRPIDLYHLYESVKLRGGFEEVCRDKLFAQIGRELGYSGKVMSSLSSTLKSSYARYLHPFEKFIDKHGVQSISDPTPEIDSLDENLSSPYLKTLHLFSLSSESRHQTTNKSDSPVDADQPSPKRFKFSSHRNTERSDTNLHDDSSSNKPTFGTKQDITNSPLPNNDSDVEKDKGWHHETPELRSSAHFDKESPIYNLPQFQKKADTFKQAHFKYKYVSDATTEKEFWSFFKDSKRFISVEYGADILSSVHGSGFPQLEHVPHDEYSRSPWNLNALPFCNDSLFRYVDADIPDFVKPSLYVGMAFSTQSWHFPDFFTGKAIYHHFGATKTWYSIPEEDFDKFRKFLENWMDPEAVKISPGLILDLNSMVSPETLIANGITCYAADQRPGQFVITFPKAHVCHFNNGFNLAESVNIAMFQDWLLYGQECAALYAKYKIPPPFSIDQLVFSVAKENVTNDSISACVALVCKKEKSQRSEIRSKYRFPESLEHTDNCICTRTHAFSYLSHVVDAHGRNWSLDAFLETPFPKGRLVLEFSDQDLDEFQRTVMKKGDLYLQWALKFKAFMRKYPRPPLHLLEKLSREAESFGGQRPMAASLRQFVDESTEWVFQFREVLASGEYDLELFQALLDQAQTLAFIVPEIELLQNKAKEIQQYCDKAENLLVGPPQPLAEYEELLRQGRSCNISLPVTDVLEITVERMRWMEQDKDDLNLDLDETNLRIEKGLMLGIPTDNRSLNRLTLRRGLGVQLESRVNQALSNGHLQISDLQAIIAQAKQTPIKKASRQKLTDAYEVHMEFMGLVQSFSEACKLTNPKDRPHYNQALSLKTEGSKLPTHPKLLEIDRNIRLVKEWQRQGKRILGKEKAGLNIVGFHLISVAARNNACFLVDGNDTNSHKVHCFCHTTDTKSEMVECNVCHENYHTKCLRVYGGELCLSPFVCQVCDWRAELRRDSARPRLEEFKNWVKDTENMPIQPDEISMAREIVERAVKFRNYLTQIIANDDPKQTDNTRLQKLQSYLRKLEGAEIVISAELIDYLRKEIHLLLPSIAPSPPPYERVEELRRIYKKPRTES